MVRSMSRTEAPKYSNRLVNETSPYLLQHAHNPVDWHPWGEDALNLATKEDKPILLSIGYSACHWCHVMERESFEDEATAKLMNEHFISIKVDREERPDIDDIYMQATLAMNHGQGGWPMTVFLTPDQKPFVAGTYFPPTDRDGRPGFPTLLRSIAQAWTTRREGLVEQANDLTQHLRDDALSLQKGAVSGESLEKIVQQLRVEYDTEHGGFGGAPKFPPSTTLSLLLRIYRRTDQELILNMVKGTLDGMAAGGMYDHVGGGFARYSTDERWLVPHFEKMLYDNALLAKVYLEAYQLTGEDRYARVARETLDYVLREMQAPEGGFYSALDADSEGVEGKFYVWQPGEITAILPEEDARIFCAYYDVTEEGNWEDTSVINTPRSCTEVAGDLGISEAELTASLERSIPLVYEARKERVAPGLDDKILTAWNGLMISAMANGARVLDAPSYLEAARAAAAFLWNELRAEDGRLLRTYRAGKAHLNAYLEDHAYLCDALIDLYEAGGDLQHLNWAADLAARVMMDYSSPDGGGFFTVAADHEDLIVRRRSGHDGAVPNANSVAAYALARLSFHLDKDGLRAAASEAIEAYGTAIERHPRAYSMALVAGDLLMNGPVEVALIGAAEDVGLAALQRVVNDAYLPNRVIAYSIPTAEGQIHPLAEGKELIGGKAAAYVCRDFACAQPVTDPDDLARELDDAYEQLHEERGGLIRPALTGHATAAGTRAYADRFEDRGYEPGFVELGTTAWITSKLGFGGYRIADGTDSHERALTSALTSGCNLIDTSTNYTDGLSERLIGRVLHGLAQSEQIRREEVIVVSKVGYIQGQNMTLAKAREESGSVFPELVKYADRCWHCIHPTFLADQLDRSLERLQLGTLDVLLLHNPEYFFSDAKKRGRTDLASLREEFYDRIKASFMHLEEEVQAGRIQAYGVSSNTLAGAVDHPESTSISRLFAVAEEVGGVDHHFRVIQLPLNLVESDAAWSKNTGEDNGETVLGFAQGNKIGVLVNRPLNAIQRTVIRLADFSDLPDALPAEEAIKKLKELETDLATSLAKDIPLGSNTLSTADLFCWGQDLEKVLSEIVGYPSWLDHESGMLRPRFRQVMNLLDQHLTDDLAAPWHREKTRYAKTVNDVFVALRNEASLISADLARQISEKIDPALPKDRWDESLSRKALWITASMPGVDVVLCGMRQVDYVTDALETLSWEPLSDADRALRALRPE
jgi:hypothetical protein